MNVKKELMPLYDELFAFQPLHDLGLKADEWQAGQSEQSRLTREIKEARALIQMFVLLWAKLRVMDRHDDSTEIKAAVQGELDYLEHTLVKGTDTNADEVAVELNTCLRSLSTIIRKSANEHPKTSDLIYEPRGRHQVAQFLYAILQEGVGKDGQTVTPVDVAEVVVQQCTEEEVNAFLIDSSNGLGFYANFLQRGHVERVGFLKGPKQRRYVFAAESFSKNQYFADVIATLLSVGIDSTQSQDGSAAKTAVLFNACYQNNLLSTDSNDLKLTSRFSQLLQRKPDLIACLVPNAVLAGGRGALNVHAVLELLRSNGLYRIFQLPPGTIAAMHQAFSLLLFKPSASSIAIEFAQLLSPDELGERQPVIDAKRGYGRPLRRQAFAESVLGPKGIKDYLQVKVVASRDLSLETANPKQRLLSLEAPYIVNRSNNESIAGVTEFCLLSDIAHVDRVQHFEAAEGELESVQFFEIGSDGIGEFGQLTGGVRRQASVRSSARLEQSKLVKGTLFLCIRGAIGKTGYVSEEPDYLTVPNQSFVKITLKETEMARLLGSDFLYWWIRSKHFQDSLAKKVIATGVPRLSIHDVRKQSVPIAPHRYVEVQRKYYAQWKSMAQDIDRLRQEMRVLQDTAWLPLK
jgi:hypothetical protein